MHFALWFRFLEFLEFCYWLKKHCLGHQNRDKWSLPTAVSYEPIINLNKGEGIHTVSVATGDTNSYCLEKLIPTRMSEIFLNFLTGSTNSFKNDIKMHGAICGMLLWYACFHA